MRNLLLCIFCCLCIYESNAQSPAYGSQFGNCVQMNGVNDYISCGNASFNPTSQFTIEAWVNIQQLPNTGNTYELVSKRSYFASAFTDFPISLELGSSGKMLGRLSNGNDYLPDAELFSTTILQPNQWYHIAFTYKANSSTTLFINGVPEATATINFTISTNARAWTIGRASEEVAGGIGKSGFKGYIDEVRIWNTERTTANILDNMNIQLAGNESGLTGYWDMNRSGQGNSLLVTNKATATGTIFNGFTVGTATTPVFQPNPFCNLPTPVISASGPTSFCNGGSVTLTSSLSTGNLWSTGETSQSILVINSGTFFVSNNSVPGCISSPSLSVTVNAIPLTSYYLDSDADGFGNPSIVVSSCFPVPGYVNNDDDCDDNAANIFPGAVEILNDIDDDCDGQVDEGFICINEQIVFSKTYGGSNIDEASIIKQTSDGGFIVAGNTASGNGQVLGNHGNIDCWILKLNAGGNIQWQKTLGGTGRDEVKSLIIDQDGGYVFAGNTNSTNGDVTGNNGGGDCWIVKLNAAGNILWQKNIGGPGEDEANSIIQTSDLGYAVCGFTTSSNLNVVGTSGNGEMLIMKLDVSGNLLWQKILGGSNIDAGTSIIQLSDGNILSTGFTNSTNGDVSANLGNMDIWAIKLSQTGTEIWKKNYGSASFDKAAQVINTIDGGFAIAGESNAPIGGPVNPLFWGVNGLLVKADVNGNIQWQTQTGYTTEDRMNAIVQKPDGSFILAGETQQFQSQKLAFNYFISTISPNGTSTTNRIYGGTNNDKANAIALTDNGGVVIAGSTKSSNADIWDINRGLEDFWIVRLTGNKVLRFYRDNDNDGYGDIAVSMLACMKPANYVLDSTDCDDTRNYVYPGAPELCGNNIDDNCNGTVDESSSTNVLLEIIGPKNICQYINPNIVLPVEYSVPAIANATSYVWRVPPTAIILSGQGGSVISVFFGSGFNNNPDKLISVYAITSCGNTNTVLFYPSAQIPSTPGLINASSSDICAVIGTNNAITYKIDKVPGATSYIWNLPSGASGITHPNGAGINDTIVEITYSNLFVSGNVTVKANNNCGASTTRSLSVVRNVAVTPSVISGPQNACEYIGPSGAIATYSTNAQGATTFNWTIPANATSVSGQGTNAISFRYPTGFTTGTISVTAINGCGTSNARTQNINTLNPSSPGAIDVIKLDECPIRKYSYTVATMPANASSLEWNVPNGGIIVSGQGTTSIVVQYHQFQVNGNVTVRAISNCRNSAFRTQSVKLPACPVTFTAKNSNGNSNNKFTEPANSGKTEILIFPNPASADFHIRINETSTKIVQLKIIDATGKTISILKIPTNETISFGTALPAGVYFAEWMLNNKKTVRKLVKY